MEKKTLSDWRKEVAATKKRHLKEMQALMRRCPANPKTIVWGDSRYMQKYLGVSYSTVQQRVKAGLMLMRIAEDGTREYSYIDQSNNI